MKPCFKITKDLVKAFHERRVGRSTEFYYLVANNCKCGKCLENIDRMEVAE